MLPISLIDCLRFCPRISYQQLSRSNNNQTDVAMTIIGPDGLPRAIPIPDGMPGLLRILTECDHSSQREAEAMMRGHIVKQLHIPQDVWHRLEQSPRDGKDRVLLVKRAVEGYKRNNVTFEKLLVVLDRIVDFKVAIEMTAMLPMQGFIDMARTNRCTEKDNANGLIWAVCRGGCGIRVEDVDAILEVRPNAATQACKDGHLALHSAANLFGKDGGEEVFERILDAHPGAVKKVDERGLLPLHLAICGYRNMNIIKILVDKYPESVGMKCGTNKSLTALHLAAALPKNESFPIVELLLQNGNISEEEQAKTVLSTNGRLPLHEALGIGGDIKTVKRLLQAFPEGIKETTRSGTTTLHIVVGGIERNNLELVQLVHEGWPDAVRLRDTLGLIPVHVAISAGADMKVVSYLLDASPQSIYMQNCLNNESLLHLLMTNENANLDVTRRVYEAHPAAIKEKDLNGRIPLHVALLCGVVTEVIRFLLEKWPDGAKEQTLNGLTALHCVVNRGPKVSKALPMDNTDNESFGASGKAIGCSNNEEDEESENQGEIESLIKNSPTSSNQETNTNKKETAHRKMDLHTVKLVHQASTNSIHQKTSSTIGSHSPLLEALISGAPLDIIQYLLNADPYSIHDRSSYGLTMLHAAILGDTSAAVVKLIHKADPNAIHEVDGGGYMPLHRCVQQRGEHTLSVAKYLMLASYSSVQMRTKSPKRLTPLLVAMQSKAEVEVVRSVVKAWPEGVSARDADGFWALQYAVLYGIAEREEIRDVLNQGSDGIWA